METNLVAALGPAFAAGFAVQRLAEISDPLLKEIIGEERKRTVIGILSLLLGLVLAWTLKLSVLGNLGLSLSTTLTYVDYLVTGLIVSAGTEGFNSILKFLSYQKEQTKASAAAEKIKTKATLARFAPSTTLERALSSVTTFREVLPEFTPGAAMNIAYRSVTATTGSAEPIDPLGKLSQYNAVDQDIPAIRARIRTDHEFGLPRYAHDINGNALKDMSTQWSLQQLADVIFDESTPVAM